MHDTGVAAFCGEARVERDRRKLAVGQVRRVVLLVVWAGFRSWR